MSPLIGPVGTTVTISGNNFSTTPSANIVRFGTVTAPVTSASATSLTVTVPTGTGYQPITVTTGGLTAYSYKPFSTTFSDPGQFISSAFAPMANFTAGQSPQFVISMDFDGDGKPDLAAATGDGRDVAVYLNACTNGAANFILQYDSVQPGGYYPEALAAGDLDGDGKPDLVMANDESPWLSVFRNTSTPGHIGMQELPALAQGHGGAWVSVADCNADGKPEIICANMSDNTIWIYPNMSTLGNIQFGTPIVLALPTAYLPWACAVADLDADGMPEIVVADWGPNLVSILRNTGAPGGAISYAANIDYPVGNSPQGIAIGDLDGDGLADIAVANNVDNTVSYLHNNSGPGALSFARGTDQPTGAGPNGVSIGDMDGDGHPDLVVANGSDQTVSVLRNTSTSGTISLAPQVTYLTGDAPLIAALADLDGNGMPDIATANDNSQNLSVLLNQSPNAPLISSFTPNVGNNGVLVTINGVNFTGATAVSFGGVPATAYSIVSSTKITATVGSGATGAVTVVTPNGTASLGTFTYGLALPPTITSFLPVNGSFGTPVMIKGTNLTMINSVQFGDIPAANFTVTSDTTITAIVGTGATGEVSISSAGGADSLPGFAYTAPPNLSITSFFPASGPTGTVVTIKGANFLTIPTVTFGGTAAGNVQLTNDSTLTVTIGAGATGTVAVTSFNGTDSLAGFTYIVSAPPPSILLTSCTPLSGATGTTITIQGQHLSTTTNVSFGGTPASFHVISDNEIIAIVGNGTSGEVTVANNNSADSIPNFVYIYDSTKTAPSGTFQLVTFDGSLNGKVPVLEWSTVNDAGISSYNVERGVDGSNFTPIATFKSVGAGGLGHTYMFTDSIPKPGVDFYRIEIKDTAANITYSSIISLQLATMTMPVYPNPVKYGFFLVDVPSITTTSVFRLANSWGMLVKTIPVPAGTAQLRIDLPELTPGTYRLSWTDGVHIAYQTILVLYK